MRLRANGESVAIAAGVTFVAYVAAHPAVWVLAAIFLFWLALGTLIAR